MARVILEVTEGKCFHDKTCKCIAEEECNNVFLYMEVQGFTRQKYAGDTQSMLILLKSLQSTVAEFHPFPSHRA